MSIEVIIRVGTFSNESLIISAKLLHESDTGGGSKEDFYLCQKADIFRRRDYI